MPRISVLCSSFNHEHFVGRFIKSLIDQTFSDWELIIIDDCSTDKNIEEIKKFNDERIHFYNNEFNTGAGLVLNRAFSYSKGEYIIEIASDDALLPDYFQKVIEIFDTHTDVNVIYSPLQVIDENDNKKEIMTQPCADRISILKRLFYEWNCLNSPGYAVRRSAYQTLLPMNFAIIQHQDYQWHIKLLLGGNCYILDKPYVCYRIQSNSKSLGTLNLGGINRNKLEIDVLMDTFLKISDTKFACSIIDDQEHINYPSELIPFLLANAAFKCESLEKRQWGYKTLIKFFENENNLNILRQYQNFQFKDLLNISNKNFYKPITFWGRVKRKLNKIIKKGENN